jgi:hypothetical protein
MTLEPQTPAEGISANTPVTNQLYRSYKVTCVCGDNEHDMHVEVEYANELDDVTVTIYTNQTTSFWDRAVEPNYSMKSGWLEDLHFWWVGLVNGFAHRLRVTWDVWFNGHVKYQATTCMTAQQALNFAETLKNATHEISGKAR